MTEPVGWDAARRRAHRAAAPLSARPVPLAQAGGAVLGVPLVAPAALPPADCSAMDGYAVRGGPPWTVVGEHRRGLPAPAAPADLALEDGQAHPVVTGSTLPKATDAVLPVEQAVRAGDQVRSRSGEPPPAGRHIRRAGEECAAGERLTGAGSVVTPVVLGLAAALGHDTLTVHPAPTVAALVTGNELATTGPPGPGRVRDAIGPMLPGLVTAAGGRWAGSIRVPDEPATLTLALDATGADLVLVTGSSGAGPADHLRSVLAAAGAPVLVDGVACRPGHPQTLARLTDGTLVAGLPGNPLAALVAFWTLAASAIAGLRRRPLPELPEVAAGAGLAAHRSAHRIVPVRIRDGVAEPVGHGGPAMLRGAAVADGLAVVDPADPDAGVERVRLLGGGASWVG